VITASKNDYGSRIKIKRRDQEKRSREEIKRRDQEKRSREEIKRRDQEKRSRVLLICSEITIHMD